MERPEEEQVYSERALQFVLDSLQRKYKHERAGRFSPPSMGKCPRRVVFGYAGARQLPPDIDNQEKMDHGSWTHLKWQVEGLTMGYMTDAEVWVIDPELLLGGSMDAALLDDSVFELKSVIWNDLQPDRHRWRNWRSTSTCCRPRLHAAGRQGPASLVYEDRGSGQFHEFRIGRDRQARAGGAAPAGQLKQLRRGRRAAADAGACEQKVGNIYKRCPFREICPKSSSISEFGKVNVA